MKRRFNAGLRHLGAIVALLALPSACASTTDDAAKAETSTSVSEADTVEPLPTEPLPTERLPTEPAATRAADVERGCEPGYSPIFSGAAQSGFDVTGAASGPVLVSICRNSSDQLHYFGIDLDSGDSIVLPACQEAPEIWAADNDGWRYVVVDERSSQRVTPGVITLYSPDGDWTTWNLWDDVVRDRRLQDDVNNARC